MDPFDYVAKLANNLLDYPLEGACVGPYFLRSFTSDQVKPYLDQLRIKNMLLFVLSRQQEDGVGSSDGASIEPQYNIKHWIKDLSGDLLEYRSKGNPSLKLPRPSSLWPMRFSPKLIESAYARSPIMLAHNEMATLWFKQDVSLPKQQLILHLINPKAFGLVQDQCLAQLLCMVYYERN